MRSCVAAFLFGVSAASAEIPRPDDAPQPLSPDESKRHFSLPEGFRIDLIAAEPLIRDPSCVAWDEKGRLFVTEIHGYNLEGHLDVTELNKSGKLDTAIRRIRVGPEMKAEAQKGQTGSLKLLKDNDGDGRMDEVIVWADDIPAAYGVVVARGGVIITAAPDILFFADTDGNDKPDVRETLFTGFTVGEMERGINNPVWGPDNWIYASQGWGGGRITGPNLKKPVEMGRTDFRFKPDGSAIEPVSGANHTFGMSFDDYGNRWLITTSQHARYAAPLPWHYLQRNPHVPTPGLTIGASSYHNTFPTSKPHPWRAKRGADPRWVKFYGAGEAQPNGNFTSGCGQHIYRAGLFPEKYQGNHFACDPQQNMVHRSIIERDGPKLRVRRPEEQAKSEFLSSSDGWFRPNNLRTGPDGALYVIDMYREIIEDYSAIPRYLQQQYGLLNGDDRGRIWRLAPQDSPPGPITHGKIVSGNPVSAKIDALYDEEKPDLMKALRDGHYAVRLHALRVADARFDTDKTLLGEALKLADSETDPNVLIQLALSLGETTDLRAVKALAMLAAKHGGIPWMDSAVLSSIGSISGPFLKVALVEHPKMNRSVLERAGETAARTGDSEALIDAVGKIDDPNLKARFYALVARHSANATEELRTIADEALRNANSPDERAEAMRFLSFASPEVVKKALGDWFSPLIDPESQIRALNHALENPSDAIAAEIVAHLPDAGPRLVAAITESLLSRPATTLRLLEADFRVRFSALQRHRLEHHENEEVRKAAKTYLAAKTYATSPSHASYYKALGGKPDVERGAKLFGTHCATCHQVGDLGIAVGPPLDAESGRPSESLLAEILDPSAQITAGYAAYLAKTKDGASVGGVLASESATSLTIVQAAGLKSTVLRRDLESIKRLDLSLMPANFAELLKPDECADIIAFIKQRPSKGPLVLFDDDPAFPGVLADGKGTATLDWKDAASGSACLTIDGFQRHQRQVPGWKFAIREKPSDGEFRYMKIAMKTRTAKGMMVELAADRGFPPEDAPIRTYYAGENSTGWKSNELAKKIPADWQTFTIDLWKGNGDFTLTGIALTTMGGKGSYDRIELVR